MTVRPQCLSPDACKAIGAGHCRRCAGTAAMAALRADPDRDAARLARIADASRRQDRRQTSANLMHALNADPDFRHRRSENGRRQVRRIARERLERSALALGVTVDLIPEVRRLQTKGFSAAQAASVLRRSQQAPVRVGRAPA